MKTSGHKGISKIAKLRTNIILFFFFDQTTNTNANFSVGCNRLILVSIDYD